MPLPSLFSNEPNDPRLTLAIFLDKTVVRSTLLLLDGEQPEFVALSKAIDYQNEKGRLVAIDQSLQELGPQSEQTNKALVYLSADFFTPERKLLESSEQLLHKICKELSLKVEKYLMTEEALLFGMQFENSIRHALLVLLAGETLSVSFLQDGKIQAVETVGSSQDPSADFMEALARIQQKHLEGSQALFPVKILVASVSQDKERIFAVQQSLIQKDWRENFRFIQQPVIERLESKACMQLSLRTFIEKSKAQPQKKDFGFKELAAERSIDTRKPREQLPQAKKEVRKNRMKKIDSRYRKAIVLGLAAGVLALVITAYAFLAFFSKIVVTIIPETKLLSKEVALTLDPDASSFDSEELILPASQESVTVSGRSVTASTGEAEVGEKASGQVEIVNKTEAEKTFGSGTVLSSDSLEFVLTDSVTIAAATISENDEGTGETKTYGKATVSVEAVEIGVESNLTAGTELLVEDFSTSSYEAEVVEALSGGSSETVQVVSERDLSSLKSELIAELLDNAASEAKERNTSERELIPTSEYEVLSENYSASAGEEADELTLELELQVTLLSYELSDVKPLAREILSQDLDASYSLSEEIELLSAVSDDEDEIMIELNIRSRAVAKTHPDLYLQKIAGKSFADAQRLLKDDETIESAIISSNPSFAKRFIRKIPDSEKRVSFSSKNSN